MAKGHIQIDQELCKGCQFCTKVCPYQLIRLADHYNSKGYRPAEFFNPDWRCSGCMLCAMMCPEAVITVFREIPVKPVPDPYPVETTIVSLS